MKWRTSKQTDSLISPEIGHTTERRGLLLMRAVWAKTHPHHKNSQPESLRLAFKSQRLSPSLSRDSISNHSEINCCKWSNSCEASHGQVWEINTIMSQRANSLAARCGNAPGSSVHVRAACRSTYTPYLWSVFSSKSCDTQIAFTCVHSWNNLKTDKDDQFDVILCERFSQVSTACGFRLELKGNTRHMTQPMQAVLNCFSSEVSPKWTVLVQWKHPLQE